MGLRAGGDYWRYVSGSLDLDLALDLPYVDESRFIESIGGGGDPHETNVFNTSLKEPNLSCSWDWSSSNHADSRSEDARHGA